MIFRCLLLLLPCLVFSASDCHTKTNLVIEGGNWLIIPDKDQPKVIHCREQRQVILASLGTPFKPVIYRVKHLNNLVIKHDARVLLKGKFNNSLSIDHQSSKPLKGYGVLNLVRLNSSGLGAIDLSWIASQDLRLTAKSAKINLSGVNQKLWVDAKQSAIIDAQYLRSHWVWVKSSGYSLVKVHPLNRLFVLAKQNSRVYDDNNLSKSGKWVLLKGKAILN
jgi:hypothetical protein